MSVRIEVTADAENDLDAEFDYLAEDNPEAARRFYKAAQQTFAQIAEMPGAGMLRSFPDSKLVGMRMRAISGFRNYLAFYLSTETSIQVLRVLHGARDIEAIFQSDN